jgi:hypothetical protein
VFCANCGQAMTAEATTCTGCGTPRRQTQTLSSREIGHRVADQAKQATTGALTAFKTFAVNPVGGLRPAMEGLGARNALGAAIVFALVFDICLAIGTRRAMSSGRGLLSSLGGGSVETSFGDLVKLLLCGLVPFVGIAGAGFVARKAFRGSGGFEGDAFIAGASLLPPAFLFLLTGILGFANLEVVAIVAVFAFCYMILILHTGCREISSIGEPGATIAVPLILLVSTWFSKIILAAAL